MPPAAPPPDRDAALQQALQGTFGFTSLRPLQRQAIDAALDGRDALVVMPTGGGKSLCYQLPALLRQGLTVVVSPLIALMQDQVDGLRLLGYPAAAAHGNLDADGRRELQQLAESGALRLLYVAPERLFHDGFLRWLDGRQVAAIAIDEAHCISQWGHDFRPEYRRLAELRERFPAAPFQAFTATATPRVREDIQAQLQLRDPALLVGTFDRPELCYRVLPRQDLEAQVAAAIERHPDAAAIVYCIARKDTEALASALQQRGIQAAAYHAGLPPAERTRLSADFRAERLHVVVATVAFGMGIDRSDVRLVVHAAMPKSLEHYQQETGRAGRDGLPAECLLLYSAADAARWRSVMERSGAESGAEPEALQAQLQLLQQMQRYAGRARCRHRALSEYFGQDYAAPNCGACDVCLDELEEVPDGAVLAQKILSAVVRTGQRFGSSYVIDVLRGSRGEKVLARGHDRLPTFGICRDVPAARLGNFIDQLVDDGILARSDGEYPVLTLTAAAPAVLRGEVAAVLRMPKQALADRPRRRRDGDAPADAAELTPAEQAVFDALRAERRAVAGELGIPPYLVFTDATLAELAQRRPADAAACRQVRGIGDKKLQAFGERFLAVLHAQCREHGLALGAAAGPAAPPRGAAAAAAAPAGPPPREAAAALFAQGLGLAAVAARIGRATSTTAGYLEQWLAAHPDASLDPWVAPAVQEQVAAALAAHPGPRLQPVFEALGGAVPFEQIRLVAVRRRGAPAGEPGAAEGPS